MEELTQEDQKDKKIQRLMYVVKEDMQKVSMTVQGTRDRVRWRMMICCGDPKRDQSKEDEEEEKTSHYLDIY